MSTREGAEGKGEQERCKRSLHLNQTHLTPSYFHKDYAWFYDKLAPTRVWVRQ